MIANIYYIIDMTDPDLTEILTHTVSDLSTLRKNIAEDKCVVKLPIGVTEPIILNGFTTYDHAAILTEMALEAWTPEEI